MLSPQTPYQEQLYAPAVASLWRRGELSWKLRAEQREKLLEGIRRPDVSLVVGNVSRRWGKTTTLVNFCDGEARKKKQHIRYATAFLTDLEEFILPIFEIHLLDCPEDLRPTYLKSKKVWTYPNGSTIKLVGLDKNPNGLRGNAIAIIVIDEAGFVSNLKHIYVNVIIPATMKQVGIKLIFISTPPESPAHYFVTLIAKAKTQPNGYYLELTIDDISDLDPAERKRLLDEVGGEDSPEAQREFFCKILVDASRAIAPAWNESIHVGEVKEEYVRNIKFDFFGDTGGKFDKTVVLKVGYCHDLGIVYFADELSYDGRTPTSEIANGVKTGFDTNSVYMDCPSQTAIDFGSFGLAVGGVEKDGFHAGLQLLNTAFHNKQALISPKCKLLILTLNTALTNKKRSDYLRDEITGHADAAAAAIYALRGVDRVTDLRPRNTSQDVWYLNSKNSQLESELQKLNWRKDKDKW